MKISVWSIYIWNDNGVCLLWTSRLTPMVRRPNATKLPIHLNRLWSPQIASRTTFKFVDRRSICVTSSSTNDSKMEADQAQLEYYASLLKKLNEIEEQNRLLEFDLEVHTSAVNLLRKTCQKHEKELQKKQEDLKNLQQKCAQTVESLKLQEETQSGFDASLRNEAAAYHSLKNDLHVTVSTHKQLTAARNKTTFEKRARISAILQKSKIVGSTDLESSTDADACAAGEHEIAKAHKQIDSEISTLLSSHPLLLALGDSEESRLRLVYSCMRDVQRLTGQGILSYDAIAQYARSRLTQMAASESSVDFLLAVMERTLHEWTPKDPKELTPRELALLKGAALKDALLANRNWYCEPEAVMYGTASLQQVAEALFEKRNVASSG